MSNNYSILKRHMNEDSPLKKRRAVEQRQSERLKLKKAILNANQALRKERGEKETLARLAHNLSAKVDRLVFLADELERTKIRHTTHVELRSKDSATKHLCVSSDGAPTSESSVLFNSPSGRSHRQGSPGRSIRRTAYTVDYAGRKYPGVCEFQDANDKRLRAEAIARERIATKRSSSAGIVRSHLPTLCAQRVPAGHPEGGVFTIEGAKCRSSKRTRFYTDHEGKRIQMDPGGWPTESGIVLL